MAISYPAILDLKNENQPVAWTAQKSILYALGVGLGSDPMNEVELPFVYEKALKAVPTLATVLGSANDDSPVSRANLNFLMILHGEQAVTFHQPLPAQGEALADSRISEVYDKGKDKGAVVVLETVYKHKATGTPIATLKTTIFARGDGGFGGPAEGQAPPHPIPTRAPDRSIDITTRPDQALLYRLSGDYNPVHCDPQVAKAAGFPRPILHGLCSYGLTCRGVLQTFCDFDPARLKHHQVRFSAPVFPGETMTIDFWKDGEVVSFEARVKARDVTVIKNGKSIVA